ncbi:acyltransferase [Kaistella flava (ex Peng et al. 2021)]|uniref:Acyltransferase n=1 Tax=Kaistella flava (ex Peng et al. 2021) TaxID=2038776 RepID=A0A7M2YAG0_9FLAO|nr:acyltransferase [Kaistella flava (ex Peng et al. 2021)]QOW10625.1 acyltransferase [Kaistella flava (ex Peng et al. 2021)]
MENKRYFDILQIYRGIASLLVVVHHSYASFEHYLKLDNAALAFIASVGKLGVDFFFVLSGFIIAYTTYNYRGQTGYLKKYTFNRVIRIYVPYLPVSFAMILLYFLFPGSSNSDRSMSLLTSVLLIPDGNPALSVAWTLVFEMFFYLMYSLNFFSKKLWYVILIVWLLGIIGTSISHLIFEHPFLKLIFNLYNLEFIMGVMVAYLIKMNLVKTDRKWFVIFPIVLFLIFLYLKYAAINLFPFSLNLIFALSAAGFVYVGIKYFTKKIPENNVWMLLGNSSYSLYLLHNPLQSMLVRVMPAADHQIVLLFELFIVIFLCCLISYFYYLIFEKHVMTFIKNKFEKYVA